MGLFVYYMVSQAAVQWIDLRRSDVEVPYNNKIYDTPSDVYDISKNES